MKLVFALLMLVSTNVFSQKEERRDDIVASLGSLKDTSATIQVILLNERVRAHMVDSALGNKFKFHVQSFSLTIQRGKTDILSHALPGMGNAFSAAQIEAIKQSIKGDKLVFDDIIAIDSTGMPRRLVSFFILVK